MKVVIIVETPNDDRLHYPLVAEALHRYTSRVKQNNRDSFHAPDNLGLNGGPNTVELVLSDELQTRVKLTEFRCDKDYLVFKAYDRLPRWLRWTMRWALPSSSGDIVCTYEPR